MTRWRAGEWNANVTAPCRARSGAASARPTGWANARRILFFRLAIATLMLLSGLFWPAASAMARTLVQPDSPVYYPYATVQIAGSGFAPSVELTVQVTRSDGSVITGDGSGNAGSDTVTTDVGGSFQYAYGLQGMHGVYRIDVLAPGTMNLAHAVFSVVPPPPCAATGVESLNTDKWGYQSGETVHLTGSGFSPHCTYEVKVIDPNLRVASGWVRTDASGNLAYDYTVVDGIQAVYLAKVVARSQGVPTWPGPARSRTDGTDLASVMFSDAAACDATVPSGLFPTIQSAVSGLPNTNPGTACVVTVLAGTYNESIAVGTSASGKNLGAGVNDSLRYIIRADPAAPRGAVVVNPFSPSNQGLQGFNIVKSQFISIVGFGLTGANPSGGSSISLGGGNNANHDITIAGNLIYNNAGGDTGSNSSDGGIKVNGGGNANTWIVNNLIRNNSRNGISIGTSSGIGPVYIVNNTIYANGFNGVSTIAAATVHVINNLFVDNGTASGTTGGRFGVNCSTCGGATATSRLVQNNLFYKNRLGDLNAVTDWIDATTDSGNYTPFASWSVNGTSGSGTTTGIAGCVFPPACSTTQAETAIFTDTTNFRLRTTSPISPAIDNALNSHLGGGLEWVPSTANTRSFAPNGDFEGTLRPQNGGLGLTVDIGYNEAPAAISGQTITVQTHAPASAAYNGTFGVAAIASSGLAVAITTTDGCSGSGSGSATITMTSATTNCVVHYN